MIDLSNSAGRLAAAVAVGLGITFTAALPSQAVAEGCESHSHITSWMSTMEVAGRGAVAELDGSEAASFVSATNRQPLSHGYSADQVALFLAFQDTPTPHGVLPTGGALAILYENGCGTDVLMISPKVMAEIVQAARRVAV